MGSYSGQRRQASCVSGWIKFALLGAIVSVFFQGALCETEPTESQCRPYIEKALKEQHLEDERNLEEAVDKLVINEEEGLPPTDELTDSTEDSLTKEDERKDDDDDDDDAEVKREDEDEDGNESAKTEEDNDINDEEVKNEQEDDGEGEDDKKNEGPETEPNEDEVKEDDDDHLGSVDEDGKGDTDDKNENDEEAASDDDDNDDDKDSNLENPIDIEIQEIEMDDIDENDDAEETHVNEDDLEKKPDERDEGDLEVDDLKTEADEDDGKEEKNDDEEEEKDEDDRKEEEKDEDDGKEEEKDEDDGIEEKKDEDDEKEKEKDEDDGKEEEKDEDDGKEEEKEEIEKTEDKDDVQKAVSEKEEGDNEKEDDKDAENEYRRKEELEEKHDNDDDDGGEGDDDDDKGVHEMYKEVKIEKKEMKKENAEEAAERDAEEDTDQEAPEEEELIKEVVIPENLRPRDHIDKILKPEDSGLETILEKTIDTTLKALKTLYDNAIKPLEMLYKYRDLSNRHFGDPEIFSKPLVLFMGPWSGGKSSTINYLLDNEFSHTSLRTGAEPSPAYFNILMHGEEEEILDGTQLAADWTFSGLQKFGQSLLDRLRGVKLPNKLLEKVNIVEIPGILEIRKQVQRLFPFNDACQWFIDRADIIFLVYDPSKLDVGPETEAILDQLKGREYQTRIILNKADQVKPEELMRVQGTLIWNISPLMSSSEPPIMYFTSLWSLPYETGAPIRLLQAQERAFLRDLREAIDKRVENKIASARRFAVRVRNHAKMVDCYLTTYYNHKTIFGNRKKISDDIIEYPQKYHIYEGLSTLTNISRYDLPDPDVYRDFFKINPLYEFKKLSDTCTYFRGCPINKLDVAIAYDLPELVGRYKKAVEAAKEQMQKENS